MSFREEFRQVMSYVNVLSEALLDVFRKRASIDLSIRYSFKKSFIRYLTAVEALNVILLPSLRPERISETLRSIRSSEPSLEGLRKLDGVVEAILNNLDKAGVLIRKSVLLTGEYGGGDDAHTVEDY